MTIYITADLHLFHSKVISRCNRPIDIDNHNDWIIKQMNKLVTPQDTVYHIGDFAFGPRGKYADIVRILGKLNGNWNFIIGNHDKEKQLESACASTRHNVLGIYHEKKIHDKDGFYWGSGSASRRNGCVRKKDGSSNYNRW